MRSCVSIWGVEQPACLTRPCAVAVRVALLLLVVLESFDATAIEPPPIAAYARLPQFDGFDVSPSGNRVLMLRPVDETQHLVVMDLEQHRSKLILASDPSSYLFNWCHFKTDDRIVCSARLRSDPSITFGRDTILFAVASDGSHVVRLLSSPISGEGSEGIVDWLATDPDHVLVSLNRASASGTSIVGASPGVYRLDVRQGGTNLVVAPQPSVSRWVTDGRGIVRLGFGGPDLRVLVRGAWRNHEYAESRLGWPDTFRILGVSGDDATAFASFDRGDGHSALYEIQLRGFRRGRTLLADPDFDIDGNLIRRSDGALVGVVYDRNGPSVALFDDQWKTRLAEIDEALPNSDNLPVSWSADGRVLVLSSQTPHTGPTYYLYDERSRQLFAFGAAFPEIPTSTIAPVRAVSYLARDGLRIPAYLTLPLDGTGRKLPTVVLPRATRDGRDTDAFSPWVQFLISRGYAVLQPNFRGSSGYGSAFLKAGYLQWGENIQNDVVDGIDWLIASGVSDPSRVCIAGVGFGGYIGLVAAYRSPEKIRCAISIGGISDLALLRAQYYGRQEVMSVTDSKFSTTTIGTRVSVYADDGRDQRFSAARIAAMDNLAHESPVDNVDAIRVPILLVHGDRDSDVSPEQSIRFAAALEKAGKPHTLLVQPGGDHALSFASQRLQAFEAMDAFLREHLGD